MTLSLAFLALAGVAYLFLLFLVATGVDRGVFPKKLVRHPLVSALALGVYASSWSFYGSVGFARSQGYLFLTIYLGVTLACLLVPLLWTPVLRLVREHQLSSLADLFAFRYRSPWVGPLVTIFMLAGALPYQALQIRAVTESMQVLTGEKPIWLGLALVATLTVFTILFGARHLSLREPHEGLVAAIAFESVVKMAALLLVGGFVIMNFFGGFSGLETWTRLHPQAIAALYQPVRDGPWGTLLLLSFSAAFLLPRQFHMAFAETAAPRTLSAASWALPLFLLLLNLAIPPILWAGSALLPTADPDYYVLGLATAKGSALFAVIGYLGGLSAASAMMIVTALALSSMCLNHLVLPLRKRKPERDLYRWLRSSRRSLIALIHLAGFAFFLLLQKRGGLAELGLVSFVATAQFLPGLCGLLFWRRASRHGFIIGLSFGIAIWAATLLVPMLVREAIFPSVGELQRLLGNTRLEPWGFTTFLSLSVNGLLFGVISLLSTPRPEDEEAALACARETSALPSGMLSAGSAGEFQDALLPILGSAAAKTEVERALADLEMQEVEARPERLWRLRTRIEKNLSGLMGPLLARVVVDEGLRMDPRARTALADHLRALEEEVRAARVPLQGAAAELEAARRYFRRVLEDLPLGVCALGPDGAITVWNAAMTRLSGIEAAAAVGLHLHRLAEPWAKTLDDYARATIEKALAKNGVERVQEDDWRVEIWLQLQGERRCFSLRRSKVVHSELQAGDRVVGRSGDREEQRGSEVSASEGNIGLAASGTVLMVADLTEQKSLQAQLAHQDRLASVGRLAAGVAHEIGNPLTGIACLAQNLRDDPDPKASQERAELILEQTHRIDSIVRALARFSHAGRFAAESLSVERFELRAAVSEALNLVGLARSARGVLFENDCDQGLQISGDRQLLEQVFVNLLTNACDASRPGSIVRVRSISQASSGSIQIEVIDGGEGIAEEIRGRIFEPFFTTKPPGEGTGLGLSLVYSIVSAHGGTVEVASKRGIGTTVALRMPAINSNSNSRGAIERAQ